MDFKELNYILAIAKYQNITKAAESLYITQPTLSNFLINLEKSLGQKLFRKNGQKYILTYAGETYVQTAKQILQLKSDLDHQLDDIKKNDIGILNVAFSRMRCSYMLPKVLPEYQKKFPNVQVNIFEGTSDENEKRLIDGVVDLAFFSKPNSENSLVDYITLCNEELLICAPKDHPIKKKAKNNPNSRYPKLELKDLVGEKILQTTEGQRTRQYVDALCTKKGITFTNTMTSSSIPAIMELVSVGYGISFIFETHLNHHQFSKPVDLYSIGENKTASDFVVCIRHGTYLPAYAQDFIEIAKRNI